MNKILPARAVKHLLEHIKEVKTVEEWASSCGYSRSYFIRLVHGRFHHTPEFILRWIRVMKVAREFHENQEETCYAVALKAGLNDDVGLNYFVKRHLGVTSTILRSMMEDSGHYQGLLETVSKEVGLPLHEFPDFRPVYDGPRQMVA